MSKSEVKIPEGTNTKTIAAYIKNLEKKAGSGQVDEADKDWIALGKKLKKAGLDDDIKQYSAFKLKTAAKK